MVGKETMKIGLDLHGVIDRFPVELCLATRKWLSHGHEVHIVTGSSWHAVNQQISDYHISFTHAFSIVDYHREILTPMELKESGWWMEPNVWDKTKGEYAARVGLDIHFEDSIEYARWFPTSCTFIHVGSNFKKSFAFLRDFLNAYDLSV